MRSLHGWQPARPSKRTCVLLMAGNQHVSNCERYIFRFWGKLKSLRKYMHFNIFERSNIFNFFLTFSIQILTFPFNNCFSRFQKKMKCCRPPSFSSTIMGRSWADHGQIMGRSWADYGRSIHAKKSWKFQLFPIPFFSDKLWKFAIFPLALSKAFSYFCRPR